MTFELCEKSLNLCYDTLSDSGVKKVKYEVEKFERCRQSYNLKQKFTVAQLTFVIKTPVFNIVLVLQPRGHDLKSVCSIIQKKLYEYLTIISLSYFKHCLTLSLDKHVKIMKIVVN